jgi:hypothetical protein
VGQNKFEFVQGIIMMPSIHMKQQLENINEDIIIIIASFSLVVQKKKRSLKFLSKGLRLGF